MSINLVRRFRITCAQTTPCRTPRFSIKCVRHGTSTTDFEPSFTIAYQKSECRGLCCYAQRSHREYCHQRCDYQQDSPNSPEMRFSPIITPVHFISMKLDVDWPNSRWIHQENRWIVSVSAIRGVSPEAPAIQELDFALVSESVEVERIRNTNPARIWERCRIAR